MQSRVFHPAGKSGGRQPVERRRAEIRRRGTVVDLSVGGGRGGPRREPCPARRPVPPARRRPDVRDGTTRRASAGNLRARPLPSPTAGRLSIPVTARHSLAASAPFYINRTRPDAPTRSQGYALPGRRSPATASPRDACGAHQPAWRGGPRPPWRCRAPTPRRVAGRSWPARRRPLRAVAGLHPLPTASTVRIGGRAVRSTLPQSGCARSRGSDAERFTFTVPVPRISDTLPPAISQARVASTRRARPPPSTGVQLSFDAATIRYLLELWRFDDHRRLIRQGGPRCWGRTIGIETQRTLNTTVKLQPTAPERIAGAPPTRVGLRVDPRSPSAQPVRTLVDSAASSRAVGVQQFNAASRPGTQVDPRRPRATPVRDSAGWRHGWPASPASMSHITSSARRASIAPLMRPVAPTSSRWGD